MKKKEKTPRVALSVRAKQALEQLSPPLRWGLAACLLTALGLGITQLVLVCRFYGFALTLAAAFIYLIAGLAVSLIAALIHTLVKKLHWLTCMTLVISILLVISNVLSVIYLVPLLLLLLLSVYFIGMWASGRYRSLRWFKKALRIGMAIVSILLMTAVLLLTIWPGPLPLPGSRPDVATLALPYAQRVTGQATDLDNPSEPGSWSWSVSYYATQGQRVDPYPGQQVLESVSVDGSELLEGWNFIRKAVLGFGPEALPLNGQVWMPNGPGPFPLVLIVHGNHESQDRSDGGYAYLGELLASHGIIAVSVDENFLNSSALYDLLLFTGLQEENDARAFVLLEHMRLWYRWNTDPTHPFYGKIDFDNLGLIGHSRGGEAAAIAAA